MRSVWTLTRREVGGYFVSPVAYVPMVLFLMVAGFLFAWPQVGALGPGQPATMRTVFDVMAVILVFVLPILTMRSLAEELKSGTIETLMTVPVTDTQVVLGKFLGCWLVYLVMLAPTLLYVVLLVAFGNPDLGPIASGYLGLALLGMLGVALGLMASSLTQNQVVAAVLAFVVLILTTIFAPWLSTSLPAPWRDILQQVAIRSHFQDFGQGVVDLVHVIYFLAATALVLFVTVKIMESRRWR